MYGGTERCITAWDQRRLSRYTDGTGIQNLFNILQTDHARARIDGDGNEVVCPGSEEMPLLGVLMKIIQNPTNTENYAMAGMTLWGSGYEAGRIIVPMFEEPAGKSLTGVVDATAEPSDSREQQVVDATAGQGGAGRRVERFGQCALVLGRACQRHAQGQPLWYSPTWSCDGMIRAT